MPLRTLLAVAAIAFAVMVVAANSSLSAGAAGLPHLLQQ